jgi:hypothetical protein
LTRKCIHLIIIFLLLSCIIYKGEAESSCTDLKKFKAQINDVKWKDVTFKFAEHDKQTVFRFNTSFSLFNPNNETTKLFYPHCCQTYETNLSFTFNKRRLDATFDGALHLGLQVIWNLSIPTGWSSESSISYLYIEKKGLTNPPDGKYVFWIFLYLYESLIISNRTLMTINEGIPEFDFDYTGPTSFNMSLPLLRIIPSIMLMSSVLMLSKKKRNN